jgi:hypothetical protein
MKISRPAAGEVIPYLWINAIPSLKREEAKVSGQVL